ncbi:FixH family protein [Bacillus sp. S/N-304-OC-R1]|uniref:FixH family protein n=1 Tax=Bacillus sp. S/N-304-OC-R1 TaxID=2758034 RepID=UPI001C8DFFB1|nr:FixH family protein [Bacillus sp. S/N-304-OC-R1]MBY0123668.1 FixH family protein [Bacillus sp. S/N-304-OC-R1]
MKKWIAIICAGLLLLAGCGTNSKKDDGKEAELPAIIEADLTLPEKANPGEEVPLAVTVKQGEEFVEDAKEVKFEIWKEGEKDSSKLVEAKHEEKGKYVATYSFPENGLYHVQSHVTARDMHTMPTKQIQIGQVEEDHHEEHGEGTEGDHHHHGDVSIHLQTPDTIKANEQIALAVHLQKENEPLVKANVRLEIFQKGSNPDWVNMTEGTNGEYKTDYAFKASGDYIVRVHVENDEGLHEHTEVEVSVQ